MRIVFMGTPEFAVPSLKILLEERYSVAGVVTAADKPSGRGLEVSASAVKQFALEKGLKILQPEKLKDPSFVSSLRELNPEVIVVVAFRILPPEVYKIASRGAFNLHASLLPRYRGAAPINWAIIKGEKETGVTSFFLEESVDTGSVILQARVPVGPEETAGELHDRLSEVGAEIVLHTVRLIENGKARPQQQDPRLATPAPKIQKEDCRIDWTKRSAEVHNFVRGLSPRPTAFTMHKESALKIFRTKVVPDSVRTGDGESVPGTLLETGGRLVVSTGEGAVELLELQQEGKRKLPADEFLRGYWMQPGERLQ